MHSPLQLSKGEMKHDDLRLLSPENLELRVNREYLRFALITDQAHVDLLDLTDETTLIVCCDWLLWHRLIEQTRHAIYYELGAHDWNRPDDLVSEFFIHAQDWLHDFEGVDPSLYRGVSIGRLFGAEISMAQINYYKLERFLVLLIERFSPKEILFFDFKFDVNMLDAGTRQWVVQSLAAQYDVRVIDRSHEAADCGHEISEAIYVKKDHGPVAAALLTIYSWMLEVGTRIRTALTRTDQRILLLVISKTAQSLIEGFEGQRLTPIFFGRTVPRKFGLLWRCFKQGVLLASFRTPKLTPQDRIQLSEIHDGLQRICETPATGATAFAREYVRQQVLTEARIEEKLQEIKSVEDFLDRFRPNRIVVDGVRHSRQMIATELASTKAIAIDYMWHSPLTPQSHKVGALGGDPRQPVFVDRCLSWGPINDAWLDRVDARQPRATVGCPFADHFRNGRLSRPDVFPTKSPKDTNVLLLQYTFTLTDFKGLLASVYVHFVDSIRKLKARGYETIRYKMHPGGGRWQRDYFQKIAAQFGLECEILKAEPFIECLAWADVVIGPLQTGALFETLTQNKPYFPLLLPPYSHDPGYYSDYPFFTSIDAVVDALGQPTPSGGEALLEGMYSLKAFPSTSRRFWEVMASSPGPNNL